MAAPRSRVLTSPLPVVAGLGYDELAAVVAADTVSRAAGAGAELVLPARPRDLAEQVLVERAGRPADEVTASRRHTTAEQLDRLGVAAAVEPESTRTAEARAATVAFVRLYDEGLVDCVEQVASVCPSCLTVIDGSDTVAVDLEADIVTLALYGPLVDAVVEVDLTAVELIEGAVAVAVPPGHRAAGTVVHVPLAGRDVPVLAEPGRVDPALLIPAHDPQAYAVASMHGMAPVRVLGDDGVVVGAGSLGGLTRFAARQSARALLEAEGAVAAVAAGTEPAERCRQCGSVAVCVVGTRWSLRSADLEIDAGDAVRDGLLAILPTDARDAFLGPPAAPWWCLERRLVGGVPLPVASCDDCGRVSVEVDLTTTCGKCLGVLRPDGGTLDPRFVAALAPLAAAGWPSRRRLDDGGSAPATTAVVPPAELTDWARPAVALARHLAGVVPFATVVVHPSVGADPGADGMEAAAAGDPRVARLALLAGSPAADAAEAVAALDRPEVTGFESVVDSVEAARDALGDAGPAQAAALLVAALRGGVPLTEIERVRALAAPFVGA